MILFKLAWRNLWRNSKCSWISIFAISTAFLILMIMSGILEGMSVQMLKNGTELFQGHIQGHQHIRDGSSPRACGYPDFKVAD